MTVMSSKLIITDALWQIIGRIISALWWFLVIKMITPYLWPLRFGDYNTILKYFAIWSALADFGLYVVALREIGTLKGSLSTTWTSAESDQSISLYYSKFVTSRLFNIVVVYGIALIIAYMIPSYTNNPYLLRWLPIGMLFSASFMLAWIVQLPHQLAWKMQDISIALTIARIAQIGVVWLIVTRWPTPTFGQVNSSLLPFLLIMCSVLVSGLFQLVYVWYTGRRHIDLQWIWDWSFTRNHIKSNRRYGIAYYLSSFHILIVGLLLSIFFPTIQGFTYVGIWWLSMSLIEILLIIPSSLWNSIIHKIAHYPIAEQLTTFGHLMLLNIWLWGVFFVNFLTFGRQIISLIAGDGYLNTTLCGDKIHCFMGSDVILPFLWWVIMLSFIKQIFNYLFVSTHHQNTLLNINGIGVVVWMSVGYGLIYHYQVRGGVITQTLLEVLFVWGALYTARSKKILPHIHLSRRITVMSIIVLWGMIGYHITLPLHHISLLIVTGLVYNGCLVAVSYRILRHTLDDMGR